MLTVVAQLADLTGIFGLGQMIWFVWLAIVLLRSSMQPSAAAVRMSNRELA